MAICLYISKKYNRICKSRLLVSSSKSEVFMSFHLSVNTVNCASQNRGILAVTIQKTGANMQSPKRRGKRAVRGQNEGSYAIDQGVGGKWST